MSYETVFDLANSGFGSVLSFLLPGIIMMMVGVFLITRRHTIQPKAPRWYVSCFSFWFFGFSVFFTVISTIAVGGEQFILRRAYAAGDYKVVEGTVENFHPMPKEGHEDESFTVKGVRFAYSDYGITAAFNNTKSHGGPISEGLPVRIIYRKTLVNKSDNAILKLEVGRAVNP